MMMKYFTTDAKAYDGDKARARVWVIDESGQNPTLTGKTDFNDVKLQHMTPKEKAQELVEKFQAISGFIRFSKAYALIAVDEIIKFMSDDPYYKDYKFFEQVKTEIENL